MDRKCYICGSYNWIENHHVFGGSNRKRSEKFGMTVNLCHYCHNEPPNGVHHNKKINDKLKGEFQTKFEEEHGTRKEFMDLFGRNYL
jgi:hypothetical protein